MDSQIDRVEFSKEQGLLVTEEKTESAEIQIDSWVRYNIGIVKQIEGVEFSYEQGLLVLRKKQRVLKYRQIVGLDLGIVKQIEGVEFSYEQGLLVTEEKTEGAEIQIDSLDRYRDS